MFPAPLAMRPAAPSRSGLKRCGASCRLPPQSANPVRERGGRASWARAVGGERGEHQPPVCCRRQHLRDAVLRAFGIQRAHRASVLEDREAVAVAHEARERRRVVRRAGLRADEAAGGRPAHSVLECARLARDRQGGDEDRGAGRCPATSCAGAWPGRPASSGRAARGRSRRPSGRRPAGHPQRRAGGARRRFRPRRSRRCPAPRRPLSAASRRRSCRCRCPCGARGRRPVPTRPPRAGPPAPRRRRPPPRRERRRLRGAGRAGRPAPPSARAASSRTVRSSRG